MERKEFLTWLSEVDRLSEAQKQEAGEVLAGRLSLTRDMSG